jgi:hypothetical protein
MTVVAAWHHVMVRQALLAFDSLVGPWGPILKNSACRHAMRVGTWWVACNWPKLVAFVVIWWAVIECVEWCTSVPVPCCNKANFTLVAYTFKVLEPTVGRGTEGYATVVFAGRYVAIADLTNPGFEAMGTAAPGSAKLSTCIRVAFST